MSAETTPKKTRKKSGARPGTYLSLYAFKHQTLPTREELMKATGATVYGAISALKAASKLYELPLPAGASGGRGSGKKPKRGQLAGVDVPAFVAQVQALRPEASRAAAIGATAALFGCSRSLVQQQMPRVGEPRPPRPRKPKPATPPAEAAATN